MPRRRMSSQTVELRARELREQRLAEIQTQVLVAAALELAGRRREAASR